MPRVSKEQSKTNKKAVEPTEKVVKKLAKTTKKEVAEATISVPVQKIKAEKIAPLSADVVDTTGKVVETMTLSAEIFGAKINEQLMSQAVRVYLANQRSGTASTKTRGEVRGSTRKIYRQKGTGRARHGGVRAPIFVHGGIAWGPKPRDFSLVLPQKMKQKALFSALSLKVKDGNIKIVHGLASIEPKTKAFVSVMKNLNLSEKKRNVLVVIPQSDTTLTRAVRNVKGVSYMPAQQLNTYTVLKSNNIVFVKEAIETIEKHFIKA